jgi:hypothetical protein
LPVANSPISCFQAAQGFDEICGANFIEETFSLLGAFALSGESCVFAGFPALNKYGSCQTA